MTSNDTAGPGPQLPGLQGDQPVNHEQAIDSKLGPDKETGKALIDSVAPFAEAKAGTTGADPKTLIKGDQAASHTVKREVAVAAAQTEDAPSEKPVRRTRKSSADKAADQANNAPPKRPRKSRKTATATEQGQALGQGENSVTPSTHTAEIPPITQAAIHFLGNPDAGPADLIRLDPASRAFVEYHITSQEMADASSKAAHERIMSMRPPISPEAARNTHAFVAALRKNAANITRPAPGPQQAQEPQQTLATQQAPEPQGATAPAPGASYAPARLPVSAQAPVNVRLARFDIATKGTTEPVIDPNKEVREARPAASRGDHEVAENSIERVVVQEKLNQPAPGAQPTGQPQRSSLPGKGILHGIVGAAQTARVWLSSKAKPGAEAGVAAPERNAGPVSLEKHAAPVDKSNIVPDSVTRRFLKDDKDYYFPDRTLAFTDRGFRLATRGSHPEVVRSMIEIAQARGWDSIALRGTGDFQRKAWLEARQAGLYVVGYQPTALDLAELATRPVNNTVEKGVVKERGSEVSPETMSAAPQEKKGLITGRLVEHGPANYQHKPEESMSYFVTLETAKGRETKWGVKLQQAVIDGKVQNGDIVTVERLGKEPVTVEANVRDKSGKVVDREEIAADRFQWKVARAEAVSKEPAVKAQTGAPDPELVAKARDFEEKKPSFVVKKHPELTAAYALLDAAKKFAHEKFSEQARDDFVGLARRYIHQQITTGQPIKHLLAYADALQGKDAGQDKARDGADLEKPAREKAVARDR